MLITKKRIRKASKYISHISDGETIYIGLPISEKISAKLKRIGFKELNSGETLFPSPELGPVSKFNAIGKSIPQKNKPMIITYRQQYIEWKWGNIDYSGIVSIPSKGYPKKWIPAPGVVLTIVETDRKKFILAKLPVIKGSTEEEVITHKINLFLEVFKQAEILKNNLEHYQTSEEKRLDWEILPKGEMPWGTLQKYLEPVLANKTKNKKIVITDRIETITKYQPDLHYVGTNAYREYIVFGFTELNLYIFESVEYGNATYVFEGDWEKLSKMTKAEIINGKLYKHRFVHREGWKKQISELFKTD